MRKNDPTTPLLAILRHLDSDEKRAEFAALADTTVAYLYQLGSCQRKSCRAPLAVKIAEASKVMAERYGSEPIEVGTLAVMCEGCA